MIRCIAIAGLVAAILLGLCWPRLAPRGGATAQVAAAHAAVSDLGPGDVVLLAVDFDPSAVPELEPFVRLVLHMAFTRGARVITMSLTPHAAMLAERYLRQALRGAGGAYGRDAVNLGFIEGRSTAIHLLGVPLQRALTRDHAGNALADSELAAEISRLEDAKLVVVAASGHPGSFEWIQQAQGRFAKHLLLGTSGNEGAELTPFWASGQLVGLVSGVRDVTAFADLSSNDPRLASDADLMAVLQRLASQMRAQRWAHTLLVVFLLAGQGLEAWRRRRGGVT